jgi:hypothetical protein
MKINELLENQPIEEIFGISQLEQIVLKASKQWDEVAKKLIQVQPDTAQDPDKYALAFIQYLAKLVKARNLSDPILSGAMRQFFKTAGGSSVKSRYNLPYSMPPGKMPSSQAITAAIKVAYTAYQAERNAQLQQQQQTAQQPPQSAPIAPGTQATLNGNKFTWLGAQWKNNKTGRMATKAQGAALTASIRPTTNAGTTP